MRFGSAFPLLPLKPVTSINLISKSLKWSKSKTITRIDKILKTRHLLYEKKAIWGSLEVPRFEKEELKEKLKSVESDAVELATLTNQVGLTLKERGAKLAIKH